MRPVLAALPLMLIAAPAVAAEPEAVAIPRELTDPAMAEKLGRVTEVLARALMSMPAGEVEAAIEGREPTAADKARTVGDMAGIDEKELAADAKMGGQAMQASMKALATAMPAIMQAMSGVAAEMEKAVANMPRPDYPKR